MEDLIRKQDAIDEIGADIDEIDALDPSAGIMKTCIRGAIWKVMGVPSADRLQGEWVFDPEILCSDIGVYSAGYRCSVCGKDYFKVDGMNYCPNCGAEMKQ